MSSYTTPANNYSLHGAEGDNATHDPLLQQQHGIQPCHFNPQQQQHSSQPVYNGIPNGNGGQPDQLIGGASETQIRGNRLRKACDSCSIRKVKCDESGPPCRACASLEIPCTFERPSRRRGPPNRHAESIKKRKLDPQSVESCFESPASPNNVAATLASFSSHAVLSAESICPFPLLELLVDDFFTYIHPLTPFPHEPSFRAAFKHREDLNNPSFLALLASMIGALVASFPRRPRLHLKVQNEEKLFPNSMSLVERCHKVAVEARGAGYLDKNLTVYDAATSYFLSLAATYTLKWGQMRLYLSEALSVIKVIGANRPKDVSSNYLGPYSAAMGPDGQEPEGQVGEPIDFIKREIGRRLFWVIFVGVRSLQQIGASFSEFVIVPPTPADPYPPLPLEVDDQYIFVDHIDQQPPGIISELTGFNIGCKIYSTCNPIVSMELAYGIDEAFDWNRQKRVLEACLRNVRISPDEAPPELKLSPGSQPGEFEGYNDRAYFASQDFPDTCGGIGGPAHPEGIPVNMKRYVQYEIQKANIYVSQLGTRSYIVEKFWNLLDSHQRMKDREAASSVGDMSSNLDKILRDAGSGGIPFDITEAQMSTERETIIRDLLRVLSSISQINMEPNGGSFIHKIRQVASTLLNSPRNRKGPFAIKIEEHLAAFLDVLIKLERVTLTHSDNDGTGSNGISSAFTPGEHRIGVVYGPEEEHEAEESRNWADLREFQTKFALLGDFSGP